MHLQAPQFLLGRRLQAQVVPGLLRVLKLLESSSPYVGGSGSQMQAIVGTDERLDDVEDDLEDPEDDIDKLNVNIEKGLHDTNSETSSLGRGEQR